jgi:hypothetical protein
MCSLLCSPLVVQDIINQLHIDGLGFDFKVWLKVLILRFGLRFLF